MNQLINQRYDPLEKLGDNSLSSVVRARDRTTGQLVTVKTIQPAYAANAAFVEGLTAGIGAARVLSHPNISRVLDFGASSSELFIVSEYIKGINLKERIRRIAPFTLSVAIDFACCITEALHSAHSLGQAHGDLRPQNVIVSPEGTLKVTDFGFQRAVAASKSAQKETLLRSAPYHAPELSTAHPGTPAGDIYALGAVLYEMLTGTPLYTAESAEAIAELHAFAPVPSPRTINPGVPRSIEGIVLKCLQKRPEQRYHTAADLLGDLKAVRDALRFGKPLSWSPIDNEQVLAAPVAARPGAVMVGGNQTNLTDPAVAAGGASAYPSLMPSKNRLRAADERVSIYVKIAIGTVTAIIVFCLVIFAAIWGSLWATPPGFTVPVLTGKTLDEDRELARQMKVTLKEKGQYSDTPRNIVFKTDQPAGVQIKPGRFINVWYSKGPEYVNVPDLAGLSREDAEARLKDLGLTVGKIVPEFNDHIAAGKVIRQDVSPKKRLLHDTSVDFVVSDGPKPDYAAGDNGADPSGNIAPDTSDSTGSTDNSSTDTPAPPPAVPSHTFNRTISIPTDGLGTRQVRIEYKDSRGWQPAVIDEPHGEGEKLTNVMFDYYGNKITMRVFYNDHLKWEKTFDPLEKGRIK